MHADLSRSIFWSTLLRQQETETDRRSQPRMRALGNAYLRLGPRDVPLIDWSRGGFCAHDSGDFAAGQFARFRVFIHGIQDAEPPLWITVDAAILRVHGGRIAGRWQPINRLDATELAAFAARKAADPAWLIRDVRCPPMERRPHRPRFAFNLRLASYGQ